MCGIAGFFSPTGGYESHELAGILRRMGDAIIHRGPDCPGYWYNIASGIALAHRRLAVVDLSPRGSQPMLSASNRYVISFNGEIYNHLQLRDSLGTEWRGTSDTETLLSGFDAWGIRSTLEKAVGMFAIAVWDLAERTLTLARDRLGEKPLYYGWQVREGFSRTFLFASDLAALKAHPAFEASINRDAIRTFMRFNNVAGTQSIYGGIAKLRPGCLLTVKANSLVSEPQPYWRGLDAVHRGRVCPFSGDTVQATDSLEAVLREAVRGQMAADVPLGAFLSGGIDSSVAASLMQVQATRPVRTYTIGFAEEEFDEAAHARAVATHLGTDHTEMYVTAQNALDVVPQLPGIYSEPFADSSQIPTFLLSKLTRQHVTVALSGDGGDELFGGYNRYQVTANTWQRLASLPSPVRSAISKLIICIPPGRWDGLARSLCSLFIGAARWPQFGEKMHKGAGVMASADLPALYTALLSHWNDPADVVIGGLEPSPAVAAVLEELQGLNDVEKMMALDLIGYMNDDILTKVDRAAMAVSLETRAPLLDHRVVEFAWSLPLNMKLRDGQTKWLLRQVLYRHVPKELIERPKSGFAVPVATWLRGPLREWAEALLAPDRLRREGYLHPEVIRKKWAEHLSGRRDWHAPLWNVLMFQAWLETHHG